MKNLTILLLSFIFSIKAFGQINMADSTAQIIGYWDKKENQSYTISLEKYKVKGADTTGRELSTYDAMVTIIDSTEKSYTVEWAYSNFKTNSDNDIVKKLSAISENIKIVIKTDEMGAFVEVVNWKEVRDNIKKSIDALKVEFKSVPK